MPILFLILADRLGLDLSLAMAAAHFFVRWRDEEGRTVNLETTSGANPARDIWLREAVGYTDRGVESGFYMRSLPRREAVAAMALTLVEHLMAERRFREGAGRHRPHPAPQPPRRHGVGEPGSGLLSPHAGRVSPQVPLAPPDPRAAPRRLPPPSPAQPARIRHRQAARLGTDLTTDERKLKMLYDAMAFERARKRGFAGDLSHVHSTEPPAEYAEELRVYAYVGGDPVNRTDPTGLETECGLYWQEGPPATASGVDITVNGPRLVERCWFAEGYVGIDGGEGSGGGQNQAGEIRVTVVTVFHQTLESVALVEFRFMPLLELM